MSHRSATLAQKAAVGFGVFFLVNGVIGLVVHPDFGTGAALSSEQFLVDWNGWHAVLSLMFAVISFVAASGPKWAVAFLPFNAVANAGTGIWVIFDHTPLGILDLPNATTDVVLHLAVGLLSLVAWLAHLARERRTSELPAATSRRPPAADR